MHKPIRLANKIMDKGGESFIYIFSYNFFVLANINSFPDRQ